ncbi:melanoma-associated antigen B5-like [Perognathus longimembris pacificus]|uniref:melanoma-associated antigen B5-like n=1 Tax=Perognathus longimembris pacificus TaxID=214514 RepID=UPI0020191BEA|nr:melanoma-associated antigen B5-like [Perognathus longimembris pacificus]
MPRGQQSKLLAREKRRKARCHAKVCRSDEEMLMIAEEGASSPVMPVAESCSTPQGVREVPSAGATVGAVSTPQSTGHTNEDVSATTSSASTDVCASATPYMDPTNEIASETPSISSDEAVYAALSTDAIVKLQQELQESPSETSFCSEFSHLDLISREIRVLEKFILSKFNLKRLTTKEEMLNTIDPDCEGDFDEIFRKTCEHLSAIFAVEVREVSHETFNLVSKLKLPNNGRVRPGRGYPKTGFVMNILGMILLKGNCAAEEDIWKFLKVMQIYPGKKHYAFGEPKKLLTQDLVRLKYLEYRQVSNSDPPRYEFLWGPQAYAETSEMEVLKFLAKINELAPPFFASICDDSVYE